MTRAEKIVWPGRASLLHDVTIDGVSKADNYRAQLARIGRQMDHA